MPSHSAPILPAGAIELPQRIVEADPLDLASTSTAATRALFQRFDLRSRRLVRSVVPLRMELLPCDDLYPAVRKASAAGATLLVFAGIEALVGAPVASTPAALVYRLQRYIDIDHQNGCAWLVGADKASLSGLLDDLDQRIASPRRRAYGSSELAATSDWTSDATLDDYAVRVSAIQREIAAGVVEGVNLSLGLSRRTDADPFDIYRECAASNPSPYGFVLQHGDFSLIGSSPLAFMQLAAGRIHLETDAGTRPVTANALADDAAEIDLMHNPKDAAEHQVVVDAELEALMPIAASGRIETVVSRQVRRFSHVMHLYSAFDISLRPGLDVADAMEALAPAAAVSGHPKRPALSLARELECTVRGPYGGVVGLVTSPLDADLSVVIRSMWITAGTATLRVGGKVVATSTPEMEYAEALSKSRFLVDAVAKAESLARHPTHQLIS